MVLCLEFCAYFGIHVEVSYTNNASSESTSHRTNVCQSQTMGQMHRYVYSGIILGSGLREKMRFHWQFYLHKDQRHVCLELLLKAIKQDRSCWCNVKYLNPHHSTTKSWGKTDGQLQTSEFLLFTVKDYGRKLKCPRHYSVLLRGLEIIGCCPRVEYFISNIV